MTAAVATDLDHAPLRPEVWPTMPPRVRELVGPKIYGTLGMIDGPMKRGFRYQEPRRRVRRCGFASTGR